MDHLLIFEGSRVGDVLLEKMRAQIKKETRKNRKTNVKAERSIAKCFLLLLKALNSGDGTKIFVYLTLELMNKKVFTYFPVSCCLESIFQNNNRNVSNIVTKLVKVLRNWEAGHLHVLELVAIKAKTKVPLTFVLYVVFVMHYNE